MSFSESTLSEYYEALSSRSSVPGGGSASALAGALGSALGCMAGNVSASSLTDADYDDYAPVVSELDSVGRRLLNCADRDARVFEELMKIYKMSPDDSEKTVLLENALRKAASVPMEICELAARTIELLYDLRPYIKRSIISDIAVGSVMAGAALKSGAINVRANSSVMTDRDYAAQMDNRINLLLNTYLPDAEKMYHDILTEL